VDPEHEEWLLQLWNSPERWAIVSAGGWAAYYNGLAATAIPAVAEIGLIGTIALPVLVMAGVFVALGSGYAAARDLARNENSAAGFAEGFVTGLLGWEWRQTVDRFARTYLVINQWDEAIDAIRVKYYNGGLKAGYSAASALVPAVRKAYLTKLRRSAGVHNPAGWSPVSDDWSEQMRARLVQTSYVIDLAAAGLRYEIIKPTQ
jgi:hypothetical protein